MDNHNSINIPSWLTEEVSYEPETDHEGFITKSVLGIMGVLAQAKSSGNITHTGASASLKIFYTLLFIILMACSKNMLFSYIIFAGFFVRCCFLPGDRLKTVITGCISGTIVSLILLLPAVFLGSPKTMLTVSIKVFISVGLVGLMSVTTPWNKITSALRVYHIPDIFIFTFDITLKYIVILGDVCVDMLTALRLRSVGKNHTKEKSFSGILGVTFLKSKEMSEEMYDAMTCRGFEGEYNVARKEIFKKSDIIYVILILVVIALFIYTQGAM